MDRSACKAIVDRFIEPMMAACGVSYWRIEVEYGTCSRDNWKAMVNTDGADYWRACITLNPDAFDSEEAVLDSLKHELLHVLLSPFQLYVDTAGQHVPSGDATRALDRIREYASEAMVRNVERMLRGWDYSRDGFTIGNKAPTPVAEEPAGAG